MKQAPELQALLRNLQKTGDFLAWLRREGESLVSAAAILGGVSWADRAQALVTSARSGHDVAARRGELVALRRLLSLELTTDLCSEEALRFSRIHPDDPRADAARACAEALDRGVRALEALRLAGLANVREAA